MAPMNNKSDTEFKPRCLCNHRYESHIGNPVTDKIPEFACWDVTENGFCDCMEYKPVKIIDI